MPPYCLYHRHCASLPQILHCLFSTNKEFPLHNHRIVIKIRKLRLLSYYSLSCTPYSNFTSFPTIIFSFFFLTNIFNNKRFFFHGPKSHPGSHGEITCHVPLILLNLKRFLNLLYLSVPWHFWRIHTIYFVECPSGWNFLMFSHNLT